ncbi:MAG: threonine synthase [Actinobacteria bacterium]|nr:threonine synthase [Actinomycetota bacterium]
MRYVSTRGGMTDASFADVLLEGLAPDGGLVVPESYPSIEGTLGSLVGADYPEVAFSILRLFIDGMSDTEIRTIVNDTYRPGVFTGDGVVPVEEIGDRWLMGLSTGPTLAFKDVAMQLLGRLFDFELNRQDRRITVLGATSGDTGSAAEQAMIGRSRVSVVMLSPHGTMSPFQAAQMYSIDEPNIVNLAVEGVFDDCQDIVKAINADAEFKTMHNIGAVNSINWGRVLAQVVYYVWAWLRVGSAAGSEIDVTVPTGNFGNVFAGWVARQMGVPIRRLVVACNENNVLDEFFKTGRYVIRATEDVVHTSSPSMDIAKASNFERFIFDLFDRDADLTRSAFSELAPDTPLTIERDVLAATGFVSGTSTETDRMATIGGVYADHGRLIDTHTADGWHVASEYIDRDVPMVCLETALPAKFSAAIERATGMVPPRPPGFAGIEDRPQHVTVIPAAADVVRRHIEAINAAR